MNSSADPVNPDRIVAPPCSHPWVPARDDGTFRNPILCADYSDPDIIRHGEDFYLTASSFNCTPGLPILQSADLVNWTIVNHALQNLPHARYAEVQPGCGVWAPAIRFHDGRVWIFFPTPDEGIYITTADDPRGRWSEPQLLLGGKGFIDPCPLWDDDGKAYLVHAYARSRAGICNVLRVRPMAPDGSKLLGEGQIVFHMPERHPTIEGPKFLKKDGWYYLLAPAGGVQAGWQVALRSKNVYGPYEDRVVLEQGQTPINGPHQGGLVDSPSGDWWFIHFQDAGVYGRITHLQPVTWKRDWPVIGEDRDGNGIGEPVLRWRLPVAGKSLAPVVPQTSDEFDSTRLGLQWQWHANHEDDWYALADRPGWLTLFSQTVPDGNLARVPNVLAQKFPAQSFAATTFLAGSQLKDGDEAGLIIIGRTHAAIGLRQVGDASLLFYRDGDAETIIDGAALTAICLRVEVTNGGKCTFGYSSGGSDFALLPRAFQATAGVWIGAKVGIYCVRPKAGAAGRAHFDWFRFSPAN